MTLAKINYARILLLIRYRHQNLEIIPAAGLALFVTAILCGLQLMPVGPGMLLVRVARENPSLALKAAAMADAAFVSSPEPGFAVVYGEASKIRATFGLAVPWKGNAPCSPIL